MLEIIANFQLQILFFCWDPQLDLKCASQICSKGQCPYTKDGDIDYRDIEVEEEEDEDQ